MKKLFLIFLFLTFTNKVYANGKILKSGFITKSASVKEDNWQENISARKNPGHEMSQGLCFQYYNQTILEYIASRLK
jgi:hypothetical protein